MNAKGFSLIELMIVIAIVGILAGISIPLYQSFIIKTQINRVVGELGAYKSGVEEYASRPSAVNNWSIGYVASPLTTGDAATEVATLNPDSSGHLEVTIGGEAHPNLAGTVVRHERTVQGRWRCVIDKSAAASWRDAYQPSGCVVL